jgi:hypothetical protein
MRKIFSLFILMCFANTYSQVGLDLIAKESCECLDAKKAIDPNLSGNELKKDVGICIIKSYSDHKPELNSEEKEKFDDTDGMGKLGETVALKMLAFCPNIIIELGKNAKEDEADTKEDAFILGEVIDIQLEQFITLQVKDQNGRKYNFLLLTYFDTAPLLANNEIKKKDKLKVSYTEIELFDSKAKEFRYFKILTKLEKQ